MPPDDLTDHEQEACRRRVLSIAVALLQSGTVRCVHVLRRCEKGETALATGRPPAR